MGESVKTGDVSIMKAILALNEVGFVVSLPMTEDSKYDLIADREGKLYRVQVKTAARKSDRLGIISIKCCSSSYWNQYKYTSSDVDLIVAYCRDTDKVYALTPDVYGDGKNSISLRFEKSKNNQTTGIRWASDYLLEKIFPLVPPTGVEPV